MSGVTNEQLYDTLLGIKSDIGALKESTKFQLAAISDHAGRIGTMETTLAKQAGAARAWGLIATAAGAVAGAIGAFFGMHLRG